MPQIATGTVSVTNGSAVVDAVDSVATQDWSAVTAGDLLTVEGSYVIYFVSASPVIVGTKYRLLLTVPYGGDTQASVGYIIQEHFNALNLSVFSIGDTELQTMLNRNFALLTTAIQELQSGNAVGTGVFSVPLVKNVLASLPFTFVTAQPNINYVPKVVIENTVDASPLALDWIITGKSTAGFTVSLVDAPDSASYTMRVDPGGTAGKEIFSATLLNGVLASRSFSFATPQPSTNYVPTIVIENTVDTNALVLDWIITGKTTAGFTVSLIDAPDSDNYVMRAEAGIVAGKEIFAMPLVFGILASHFFTFATPQSNLEYVPNVVIENTVDATAFALDWIITAKTIESFTVSLVDAPPNGNYTMRVEV